MHRYDLQHLLSMDTSVLEYPCTMFYGTKIIMDAYRRRCDEIHSGWYRRYSKRKKGQTFKGNSKYRYLAFVVYLKSK